MPRSARTIRRQLLTLATIPLVALLALWGFATYLTVGDGYRLYDQGRLITEVAAPAEEILGAIQGERRASAVYLTIGSADNLGDLTSARNLVNQKITAFRAVLTRGDVQRIAAGRIMDLAQAQVAALDKLDVLRRQIETRSIDTRAMMDAFTGLVDPITPLYAAVATFPDDQVAAEGQALQRLAHARELRARTDAILAGALTSGRFTRDGYLQFVQAVGLMRAEYHETYVRMSGQFRGEVDAFFAKEPYTWLTRAEDAAIATNGTGPIPVNAGQWRDANTTALAQLSDFQLHLADIVSEHAKGPAYVIFGRIIVAGLVGLIVVVVTVVVSLRIARRLSHRLRHLSASARTLSDVQLPDVVDRLSRGEHVDVDAEAPMLERTGDEIGGVSAALNAVRRTAIRTAVEQAELRAGIRNVFINIARRSQTLVRQQLAMLDVMERKTVDPEELADLFRVDHLATRMQRYAENLVILGGGRPGRRWGEPVAMLEVLRGAASEAEQYERVRVQPIPRVMLAGSAVSDVLHLVAELIDNATRFSPPDTLVQVSGQVVPNGVAVEVVDRGLGMSDAELAAANAWLAHPPEFNVLALSDSPRLGMFVVARVAARHDIRVSLHRSSDGGVTAVILLPANLVAEAGDAPGQSREEPVPAGVARSGAVAAAARQPVERQSVQRQPIEQPPAGRDGSDDDMDGDMHGDPNRESGDVHGNQGQGDNGDRDDADSRSARTHLGLPVRVRQAGLAPGLRDNAGPAHQQAGPPQRSAEEVRRMMSAYQRGTVRGRQPIEDGTGRSSTLETPDPTDHRDEESR